ncbi:MAG: SRPBCC family protein [Acidobacteriota bacterium]
MRIEHSIETRATPESLWNLLTDPEQIKQWIPELISDEPTTPGQEGVGTKTRMRLKEGSKIVEYSSEITTFTPPQRLGLRLTGGHLGASPMEVEYRFSQVERGTAVHYTSTWQPRGLLLRLLSPLLTAVSKRNIRAQFQRLRSLAEAG